MASVLNLAAFVPPAPTTVRGAPCLLSADAAGKLIAYASGSNVVVRNVQKLDEPAIFFTDHPENVTSVQLSPSGSQCASGDKTGKVFVWYVSAKGEFATKKFEVLSGPVKDIAWSHDAERLAIVGEGRDTTGVALNVGMGTTSKLTGHTKSITTVDLRKDRPFRVVTGSQDSNINFYEGPPFVFKHSTRGHQSNVNCVRYSPHHELIASVSGSDGILIQDGKTGEAIRTVPSGHSGTIYCLTWVNNTTVATASADKTVRTVNVVDGTPGWTCVVGTDLGSMQLGVVSTSVGLISVGLNGVLSFIVPDSGTVSRRISGQSNTIHAIAAAHDSFVTASADGRFVRASLADPTAGALLDVSGCEFVSAGVLHNGHLLTSGEGRVFDLDIAAATATSFEAAQTNGIALLSTGALAVTCGNVVNIVSATGATIATYALAKNVNVTKIAAGGKTLAVAHDAIVEVLKLEGSELQPVAVFKDKHLTTVTALAVSDDGSLVASGDSTKVIFVWSAATAEVLHQNLVYHRARVNCLRFAPGSTNLLASGSLDWSVIVWDLAAEKRSVGNGAHYNGVSAITWLSGDELLTAGADCSVRRWRL